MEEVETLGKEEEEEEVVEMVARVTNSTTMTMQDVERGFWKR
jgi:hypothetical protein